MLCLQDKLAVVCRFPVLWQAEQAMGHVEVKEKPKKAPAETNRKGIGGFFRSDKTTSNLINKGSIKVDVDKWIYM